MSENAARGDEMAARMLAERVLTEEARACVDLLFKSGTRTARGVARLRWRMWYLLHVEAQWSPERIAVVWRVDRQSVRYGIAAIEDARDDRFLDERLDELARLIDHFYPAEAVA